MNVATVYIPRGNTRDQYCGTEQIGTRCSTQRQKPRRSTTGNHPVAMAQKRNVSPRTKGESSRRNGQRSAESSRREPASVVMARAPMLIQYGGVILSAARLKKSQR